MLQNQRDVNALIKRSGKYVYWNKIIKKLGIKNKKNMSDMEILMLNNFVLNNFVKIDDVEITYEDEEHYQMHKIAKFISDKIYDKNQ